MLGSGYNSHLSPLLLPLGCGGVLQYYSLFGEVVGRDQYSGSGSGSGNDSDIYVDIQYR